MPSGNRPLSPFMIGPIYRPQITSVLSIVHRITGVAMTAGTVFLTWWLVAAAYGAENFASAQGFLGSFIGHLLLWGFTFSLFYHLFNGIRHLAWDFGWGFEIPQLRQSGIVMLAATGVCTIITLIAAYA